MKEVSNCCSLRPLREKVAEGRMRGFTLIELLVVVIIIAILAAIAVPQYKKAVIKSRYAMLKNLAKSIAVAEEVYYLANGQYTTRFDQLDIDAGGTPSDNTDRGRIFDWGHCYINLSQSIAQVGCANSKINMQYQQRFTHSPSEPDTRVCIASPTDITDVRNQICQAETHRTQNNGGGASVGYLAWTYED